VASGRRGERGEGVRMGRGLGTEIDDGQGETEREERPREEAREVSGGCTIIYGGMSFHR
jgi:hypothetical protein